MSLQEIENQLRGLSLEELKELNSSVVDNIKFMQKRAGEQVKRSLLVGSRVQFTGRNGAVLEGELIKKNRTKAVVSVQSPEKQFPTHWTVPFNMLSTVAS